MRILAAVCAAILQAQQDVSPICIVLHTRMKNAKH